MALGQETPALMHNSSLSPVAVAGKFIIETGSHFCVNVSFPWFQKFTQSMRMERLSLEQSMEGFSSQSEHTDESDRKRMATKVGQDTVMTHWTVGVRER